MALSAKNIRALRYVCGALFCVAIGTTLRAVAPNFASISPAGGQRGHDVEVTLRGDRLADSAEIQFYEPGITVTRLTATSEKLVKATLHLDADCSLGTHALRLRTASGVSALRLFFVGPFPSVEEKEPNNDAATAQRVALNTTVEGVIANEDIDRFLVAAKQGQRLSVEVEGARLGRTMFDPYVAIRSRDGRLLVASDDTPLLGHDGYVSTLAPADGDYLVELRDVAYSGNGHVYRLHIGDFPRPAISSPLGGQPGETVAATFIGDPRGEFTQTITLPKSSRGDRYGIAAEHDGIAVSPNWFRVVDLPTVRSVTTGATLAAATVLDVPAPLAFEGVLAHKAEPAFFRFKARKGQNLNVEVFARRLGSPLDSVLTVFDPKGKSLGSNDDASGNPDSAVRVRISEDGAYTVKVADQLGRGGPAFAYRVEIAEVAPVLTLSIPDTARYDNETRKSLVVPRGNRFAILLNVARDGFNADLKPSFEGLPAGVTMSADVMPASVSAMPVVFEAADDAAIAGTLLRPTAVPVDPSKSVASRFRHNVDWVRIQNDTVYVRSEVDQLAAAVVEEVPFKVRIVEPKVPLVQSGELALQVMAERAPGFDEPITVKMLWNPPGVSAQPEMVIPKGSDHIAFKLNATNKADVRSWKIAVIAGAPLKGGTAYVSSQLAALDVAAPYLFGKMDLAKVERGQRTRLVCTLDQKVAFEGVARARLVGLPANTTAAEVEITKDSKEAVFEVVTTDQSPLGITKNVFCQVVITRDGEPITHTIAAGSVLRIDAPRARPAAVASTVVPAR